MYLVSPFYFFFPFLSDVGLRGVFQLDFSLEKADVVVMARVAGKRRIFIFYFLGSFN